MVVFVVFDWSFKPPPPSGLAGRLTILGKGICKIYIVQIQRISVCFSISPSFFLS